MKFNDIKIYILFYTPLITSINLYIYIYILLLLLSDLGTSTWVIVEALLLVEIITLNLTC